MILVDAGPLVALIHRADRHHEACRQALETLNEPLATVWPAFTEAMYLLGFSWQAQAALWQVLDRGVLTFLPLHSADHPRMQALMEQYRDLPMDLADAALVRVAEREGIRRIFTLDRRDFQVYRPKGLGSFQLIPDP
jgi:predicted nucleic acid-binding protein